MNQITNCKLQLKVMTFNIRYAKGDLNTKNDWNRRKNKVISIIQKYQPDFIGFQEVLLEQLIFLKNNLPEYNYIGVGRDDGDKKGEFNPIFYKNKISLEKYGTFWLSKTPDVCSKWKRRYCYRICTWGNFKLKIEKDNCNKTIKFALYNTHLEVNSAKIRLKSIPLILNKMQQYSADYDIVLTGDFNFTPDSKEYKLASSFFKDSYKESNRFDNNKSIITFHDFKGDSMPLSKKAAFIDYIWLKESRNSMKAIKSFIIKDNPPPNPDTFPSDHFPILSLIEIS
ncbi:MAG: endonuclease/exonuclease/phosphatase family protein [Promethearchaeota archaeon]